MLYNDIDFRNSSDTGEPEATAIQPYLDGEPAGQGVLRRPVENTRSRSDLLRQTLREHLVLRDLQQVLLVGGGTFTFGGAKPTYTGVFTTTADLEVRPFATPGADASPYTVSTKASVLIGSVDIIKFESKYKQWQDPGADPDIAAEADMISVEIVHTGALSVAVQGAAGQPNNIYVTINYGTTTCQEVIDAVNGHTSANKLVVASLASGTNTNPASKFSTAEWGSDWSVRFLRGGAPGLLHVITAAVFATFFAAHVDNPLRKGDTLAIWYDDLIDLATQGGRLQSTPENSNYQIPATSLFNTRREPEKIPNCVPICKCVDDNTIIFVDGSRITRTTAATLWWDSAHLVGGSSSLISVAGWTRLNAAPGAHVPPATVQQALDNIDDIFEAILNGGQAFVASTGHRGVTATGEGANEGVKGTGGLTGDGVHGTGGATSGLGVLGTGTGGGAGVRGVGGGPNGMGVSGEGAGAGVGVQGTAASGGGGGGVSGVGDGVGVGVFGQGGDTGRGVVGQGGATSGRGVEGSGAGSDFGVYGLGGPTNGGGVYGGGQGNGNGLVGQGAGSGKGVNGTGGATAGAIGVKGTGGSSDGVGVEGQGVGTGAGVRGISATGPGVTGKNFTLDADEEVVIPIPLLAGYSDDYLASGDYGWRAYWATGPTYGVLNPWGNIDGLVVWNVEAVLPKGFKLTELAMRWRCTDSYHIPSFPFNFRAYKITHNHGGSRTIVQIGATTDYPSGGPYDTDLTTFLGAGANLPTVFTYDVSYGDTLLVIISSYGRGDHVLFSLTAKGKVSAPGNFHAFRSAT